jgi:hypothetical protein
MSDTPTRNMNVEGIFKRGYYIAQTGRISFSLNDKSHNKILDFEVDNGNESIHFVHKRLLAEIDYLIDDYGQIEYELDTDDVFKKSSEREAKEKNDKLVEQLELIGDILR